MGSLVLLNIGEKGVLLTRGIGLHGTLEGRQGAYSGQDCQKAGLASQYPK